MWFTFTQSPPSIFCANQQTARSFFKVHCRGAVRRHHRKLWHVSYLFPRQVVGRQQTSHKPDVHLKHRDFCILQQKQKKRNMRSRSVKKKSTLQISPPSKSDLKEHKTQQWNVSGVLVGLEED